MHVNRHNIDDAIFLYVENVVTYDIYRFLNDKFTKIEQLVGRLYKRRVYDYGFSLNEISE